MRGPAIDWSHIEYAFGGSSAAGAAEILASDRGVTGVPFHQRRRRLRYRGSALISAYSAPRSGVAETVMAIASTRTRAAPSTRSQATMASATGTARRG